MLRAPQRLEAERFGDARHGGDVDLVCGQRNGHAYLHRGPPGVLGFWSVGTHRTVRARPADVKARTAVQIYIRSITCRANRSATLHLCSTPVANISSCSP